MTAPPATPPKSSAPSGADPAAMPQALLALELAFGATTRRVVEICVGDDEHAVVSDAFARWSPLFQEHLFSHAAGGAFCSECSGPIELEEFHISNARAIERLRADLRRDRDHLARLAAGAATPQHRAREVCGECGAEAALIDAYAAHDPVLNRGEVVATFDKGHSCDACGEKNHPRRIFPGGHEAIALVSRIVEEAARLDAEILAVDAWLASHGSLFGYPA